MLNAKGGLILRYTAKAGDEGSGISVRNLQAEAQQHGKGQEHSQARLQEQAESIQSECLNECLLLTLVLIDSHARHRQGVGSHNKAQGTTHHPLARC